MFSNQLKELASLLLQYKSNAEFYFDTFLKHNKNKKVKNQKNLSSIRKCGSAASFGFMKTEMLFPGLLSTIRRTFSATSNSCRESWSIREEVSRFPFLLLKFENKNDNNICRNELERLITKVYFFSKKLFKTMISLCVEEDK